MTTRLRGFGAISDARNGGALGHGAYRVRTGLGEKWSGELTQIEGIVAKRTDPELTWHILNIGGNVGAAFLFLTHCLQGRVRQLDLYETEPESIKLATFHQVVAVGTERLRRRQVSCGVSNSVYNRYRHALTEYTAVSNAEHKYFDAVKFADVLTTVQHTDLFLKLDCEGVELAVLSNFAKALSRTVRHHDCCGSG